MRGEHTGHNWRPAFNLGSSPHARGTRLDVVDSRADGGIIPACAGNTSVIMFGAREKGDHPRMRGEHVPSPLPSPIRWGSSPHARGTPSVNAGNKPRRGIIPACAGNTARMTSAGPPAGDHPRMRGEHVRARIQSRRGTGSSPHARGTLSGLLVDLSCAGIIPACAGNTLTVA
ncbi:hypothetical protein BBOU_0618 [Bifidobacterium boum]|uniref:Uncharacterized protein n=1 Tax=Bifidobacterium boum TaxID=78343 RepID=A0A086ZPN9_9BIFI|nr:hypothetical protein BBOU_0618 [Bifidobacterium boum]